MLDLVVAQIGHMNQKLVSLWEADDSEGYIQNSKLTSLHSRLRSGNGCTDSGIADAELTGHFCTH